MRSELRAVLAVFVACLVTGCGGQFETRSAGIDFGTDIVALQPFGVAVRCRPGDDSCTEHASRVFEPMMLDLGEPYDGAGVQDTSGSPAEGSLLLVFHRDPAVQWRAAGSTGTTERAAIDVGAYLLGIGDAYVVVDSDHAPLRFKLPDAAADELISALYLRP